MKKGHINMHDAVTNMYQIDSHRRQPQLYVYVYNRFYRQPKDEFKVKKGRLPGVLAASVNWEADSTAGSFSVELENAEGMMTPEYTYGKVPLDQALRGHLFSPWKGQLVPNNKVEFWFGYGNEVVLEMTGLIDNVTVNAESQTVSITGRSMYKVAIDTTCRPYPGSSYTVPYPETKVTDAIAFLLRTAKVKFEGIPIIDETTNEEFIVGEPLGMRGEKYDAPVQRLVRSVFHHLREEPNGVVKQMEVPRFTQETEPDFVIDEERHIMSLEYNYDDTEMYGTVIIESNKIQDKFSSHFITEKFLNGQHREVIYDYPWANNKYKRQLAAQSEFTRMLYQARTISVTIPANPLLQIYDTVRVLEKISLARWNYHIRSITTEISASGFTQTLGLTVNTGFEKPKNPPKPQTSLPAVRVPTKRAKLGVWDSGVVDMDIINIRLNGEKLAENVTLSDTATVYDLDLKKGSNVLEFIGVSAGFTGGIEIGLYIEDENGVLLTPDGAEILMPRGTTNKQGFIKSTRPVRRWVINRA